MKERKNNSFEEIWEKIEESKRILMTLHSAPDGDSLGACTSMKYVLEREFDKDVTIISGDAIPSNLQNLPFSKEVKVGVDISEIDFSDYDLLLTLDTATPEMLGRNKQGYKRPKDIFIINIDHHVTNFFYGDMNYVEVAPSACSVLLELFKMRGIKFDKELSIRILTGICTDSGFFRYEMDLKRALTEAVFLIEQGVDYFKDVLNPIVNSQTLATKKYFGALMSNLKINKEKNFAYSTVDFKTIKSLGLDIGGVRGGVSAISDLEGVDFSFILLEMSDYIKGSFRSNRRVDVSLFAKELGGGGHQQAAGVYLRNMGLKEAEEKVLKAIEKVGIHRF